MPGKESTEGMSPSFLRDFVPEDTISETEESFLWLTGDKPSHFGPYQVVKELGRGGMGCVYLVNDTSLGRQLALKVLLDKNRANTPRFHREARMMASLAHPNIARVHKLDFASGTPYLVMDYIEGQRLDDFLKDRSLAIRLAIIAKIARALHYAHRKNLVHRDIKPGNILVDSEGTPYLMDFGLARGSEELSLTKTGDFLGTMQYMSPEQAKGDHRNVDRRSDIYSLGAVLYEIVVGVPAVQAQQTINFFYRIIHEQPRPLREIDDSIPEAVEAICTRAMHKDKNLRYQTALGLARDIEKFLDSKTDKRRRPLVAICIALLAIGVGYSLLITQMVPQPSEKLRDADGNAPKTAKNVNKDLGTANGDIVIPEVDAEQRTEPNLDRHKNHGKGLLMPDDDDAEMRVEGDAEQNLQAEFYQLIEKGKQNLQILSETPIEQNAVRKNQRLQARDYFKKALAIYKPNFLDAAAREKFHRELRELRKKIEEQEQVATNLIDVFRLEVAISPTSEDAHANLALSLYEQGNYREALRHFRQAWKYAPQETKKDAEKKAGHLVRIGECHHKLKEYEQAEKCYFNVLYSTPSLGQKLYCRTLLRTLYDTLGKKEKLRELEKKLREMGM